MIVIAREAKLAFLSMRHNEIKACCILYVKCM